MGECLEADWIGGLSAGCHSPRARGVVGKGWWRTKICCPRP